MLSPYTQAVQQYDEGTQRFEVPSAPCQGGKARPVHRRFPVSQQNHGIHERFHARRAELVPSRDGDRQQKEMIVAGQAQVYPAGLDEARGVKHYFCGQRPVHGKFVGMDMDV